jgi:hypothetical protein
VDLAELGHEFSRRGHGADLPAGDVIGLAEAGDDEGACRQAGKACRTLVLASVQRVALGLCGLLMISSRVRGVMAAAILAKSGLKLPGVSGTRTGTPPASSMLGT